MHPTENVRVPPVAMTAGKVWQGLERFGQRSEQLLRLIEPLVLWVFFSMTVLSECNKKKMLERFFCVIMIHTKKKKKINIST